MAVIVLLGTVGCVYAVSSGDRLVGPVKAALLSCLEPLTAATLSVVWLHSSFSDGPDRVCVHSGNGGADEVERNYGSFPTFTCIPASRMLGGSGQQAAGIFYMFLPYVLPFILPDFYFTIPIKKMVYCCGRKKISARSKFFRGK